LTHENADPLLPSCCRWDPYGAVEMRLVPDARPGKKALKAGGTGVPPVIAAITGGTPVPPLNLELAIIEVAMGATYSFGG